MSDAYIGEIIMFAGNFAPKNWALCDGQLLSIAQNTALFSILGTTYGGDGRVTFGLPDLRGRVAIHAGQGPGQPAYTLGQMSGAPTATLTINQMPAHNHSLMADANAASTTDPSGAYLGNIGAGNTPAIYSPGPPAAAMGPQSISIAGGSQPFSIMQPYNTINYIICLYGIFPSRN